jgi:hypothetical protein
VALCEFIRFACRLIDGLNAAWQLDLRFLRHSYFL